MEPLAAIFETNSEIVKGVIVILGLLLTFFITNLLIRRIVLKDKRTFDADGDGKVDEKDAQIIRDGYIIGKCENIIIFSFVLADELTGLALIFAAKGLARQRDINKNAGFFLVGTLVNFTATLLLAFVVKHILFLVPG